MTLRDRLLNASKKADAVHRDLNSAARIKAGYARVDPVAMAEEVGVVVMSQPMDKLLGAFLREERPGILINTERPVGMRHMTCAHELGHFFLGHVTTADEHLEYGSKSDVREREANSFAYTLMAPKWLVQHAMRLKGWGQEAFESPATIYQLSLRLGISYSAMVWGLNRLKALPDEQAERMAQVHPKTLKQLALPSGVQAPSKSDVWLLDARDKDWVIEPRSTDRFILRLPSHATAGYLWSAEELQAEGFTLKPVVVDARTQQPRSMPPLVGGALDDLYTLERPSEEGEAGPSKAAIRLHESQPWSKGAKPVDCFALKMEFEQLTLGLSGGTRKREVGLQ